MKVELEFDTDMPLTAMEGVACLSCFDENGEHVVLYGHYGEPSSLAAIGLYTVGLQEAKAQFSEGEE
jgi:hypothetical protein